MFTSHEQLKLIAQCGILATHPLVNRGNRRTIVEVVRWTMSTMTCLVFFFSNCKDLLMAQAFLHGSVWLLQNHPQYGYVGNSDVAIIYKKDKVEHIQSSFGSIDRTLVSTFFNSSTSEWYLIANVRMWARNGRCFVNDVLGVHQLYLYQALAIQVADMKWALGTRSLLCTCNSPSHPLTSVRR